MVRAAALALVALLSTGCALLFEVVDQPDGEPASDAGADAGPCRDTCREALELGGTTCTDPAAEYFSPLFECGCGDNGVCKDECSAGLCAAEPVSLGGGDPDAGQADACAHCLTLKCTQPYNGCLLHGG
jgi:hypothetical protein